MTLLNTYDPVLEQMQSESGAENLSLLLRIYDWLTFPHLLLLFTLFLVVLYIYFKRSPLDHWHHTFDNLHIPPQEFYKQFEASLFKRNIPRASLSRIARRQTILVGSMREYVRVEWESISFEVCCAHVGTGCFVSWWFFSMRRYLIHFLAKLPVVRMFLSLRTFYQIDEEKAVRDLVHTCVLESIDALTGQSGSTLSESERAIVQMANTSA